MLHEHIIRSWVQAQQAGHGKDLRDESTMRGFAARGNKFYVVMAGLGRQHKASNPKSKLPPLNAIASARQTNRSGEEDPLEVVAQVASARVQRRSMPTGPQGGAGLPAWDWPACVLMETFTGGGLSADTVWVGGNE